MLLKRSHCRPPTYTVKLRMFHKGCRIMQWQDHVKIMISASELPKSTGCRHIFIFGNTAGTIHVFANIRLVPKLIFTEDATHTDVIGIVVADVYMRTAANMSPICVAQFPVDCNSLCQLTCRTTLLHNPHKGEVTALVGYVTDSMIC